MAEQIILSNQNITVEISTLGAEMRSLKKNGKEMLWDRNPDVWASQAPVLFPICGGLKDDKFVFGGKEYILEKHGFARRREFAKEEISDEKAVFLLSSDAETKKMFPFDFELRIIYTLTENSVNITYKITNTGDKNMYFSIGSHEGFMCKGGFSEYAVEFSENESFKSNLVDGNLISYDTEEIAHNGKVIPLKDEYFAIDALIFFDVNSDEVTLKHGCDSILKVKFDKVDCLLIWTKPGTELLCIEPWYGSPDFVDADFDITHKKNIIETKIGETVTRSHSIIL